ncbi:MAG: o-succinylbenzoate synthase [Cyclobacteriaceae bacterium]
MLRLEYTPYTLDFKFLAKTSRGALNNRKVWFIKIQNDHGEAGIGEIAPIARLSREDPEDIPGELEKIRSQLEGEEMPQHEEDIWQLSKRLVSGEFSSIRMGLETALFDLLNGGEKRIFRKDYQSICLPVNGLVWMGDTEFMKSQIKEKLDDGFNCIKLKVGALDFDTEIAMIRDLRAVSDDLIIRLDANGAFQTNEVLMKLKALSKYNIHSVEQPILPMQPEAMEIVCSKSQIPIAFDEELIWVENERDRLKLLQELRPQYLVLKPALHGGFSSIKNWIDLAAIQGIDWWITSYLESNVGLNAIAQFASCYENKNHHGLGTGSLYHNNIVSPIQVDRGYFKYAKSLTWGEVGL